MNQNQLESGKKPFFRAHIEAAVARRTHNNLFHLRTNKWRLSTFDKTKGLNSLKLRGPLAFAFGSIFVIELFSRLKPAVGH